MWIIVVVGIFFFVTGVNVGVAFKSYWHKRFTEYNGTIVVNTDVRTEKIVYSLVLDDYPETLQFKKMVLFKVEKESDRD
jgi:hypothetical protein